MTKEAKFKLPKQNCKLLLQQQKLTDDKVERLTKQLHSQPQFIKQMAEAFYSQENGDRLDKNIDTLWNWANRATTHAEQTTGSSISFQEDSFWKSLLTAQPCTQHTASTSDSVVQLQPQSELSTLLSKVEYMQVEIDKNNLIY